MTLPGGLSFWDVVGERLAMLVRYNRGEEVVTEDPLLRTGCFDNVIADDDPDTTCSWSSTVTLGVA